MCTLNLIPAVVQFLSAEAVKANGVFNDLQMTLSTHQSEMADFSRELRQVCIMI